MVSKKKAKKTALRRRNRQERNTDHHQQILRALDAAGAPLTPKELAKRLRVHKHAWREFEAALGAMQRAGLLVENRAGSLLVARRIALVAGRIEGHPDGHGFLVPDDRGPSVFLPPSEMREVIHGDRAAVRVEGRDHRG